jgi:hypothetical protein
MLTRRTFILAGVAGAATLVTAGWLRTTRVVQALADGAGALDPDADAVLTAVVPVFLAGALPSDDDAARRAMRETIAGVGTAIAGLPPAAQRELAQLFALLGFAPARIALAGVTPSWREAGPAEVAAFLARWRDSSFLMFRSAYAALHQLVFAAWYGNPASWPAIGYPGPPRLSS